MNISIYDITVPQFINSLKGLKGYLMKAQAFCETKKIDMGVLFQSRLAPDQFPLSRQIQIACDNAKMTAARMAGVEAPSFEDNEQTLEQFVTRIDKTIAFLEKFSADQFKDFESKKISFFWNPGFYLDGRTYMSQYALPNFYFHLTTAYSILRSCGLDLGKRDYLNQVNWQTVSQ